MLLIGGKRRNLIRIREVWIKERKKEKPTAQKRTSIARKLTSSVLHNTRYKDRMDLINLSNTLLCDNNVWQRL